MTPQDRERVLKACGFEEHRYDDPAENYWTKAEMCRGKNPLPTQRELWETLCRVCREMGYIAKLVMVDRIDIIYGEAFRIFSPAEHGSLTAAIEEAILWVLNQKEGRE